MSETDTNIDGAQLEEFKMPVQGGMLEALGINLYANLGKCLVEFAANSYDSDANFIDIEIPFEEISSARKAIRLEAETKASKNPEDAFQLFEATIPDNIIVTIKDDGHGMSPNDVQNKFLPLNRNRRETTTGAKDLKSKSGKRFVMGRKGLGKLAGFGAAEKITIKTSQIGQDFETTFVLDLEELKKENLGEVPIKASYTEVEPSCSYTEIQLSKLKYGSTGQRLKTIEKVIDQNFFGISSGDFDIRINSSSISREVPEYELMFPQDLEEHEFAESEVALDNSNIKMIYGYRVKFRKRGDSLKASQRGVRVYCNNRLAAGPTLLGLNTGMHNFYAIDYMEMIVEADELDRHGIDLINTNRTQLKSDNELVEKFFEQLETHMKSAVKAHGAFRDNQTKQRLQDDPDAKLIMDIVSRLPKKSREAGRKLIQVIGNEYGVGTEQFNEMAPLVVQSMNAGEVLIRLIEAGTRAETVKEIGGLLCDLTEIEQEDALKLFKARKSGIISLSRLIDKGEELWKKSQFENELHLLLKQNPWLLRTDLSMHISSDNDLQNVASKIAKELSIDSFAPIVKDDGTADRTRPDLIHILSDSNNPTEVHIIELKSPALPLNLDHYDQLDEYIFKIDEFLRRHYDREIPIRGFLIGTRPSVDTKVTSEKRLLRKIQKFELGRIEILGLQEMLSRTQVAHSEMISVLKADLEDDTTEEEET